MPPTNESAPGSLRWGLHRDTAPPGLQPAGPFAYLHPMAEIVPLSPIPDASVIESLESVLEQARAGTVSSVAIAIVYRDGKTGQHWSTAPLAGLLAGAIARLGFRYNEQGIS